MRLLILTLYPDNVPSSRFRIGQYLPLLRADGFQADLYPAITKKCHRLFTAYKGHAAALGYHCAEFMHRLHTLLCRQGYDLLLLQKGLLSFNLRGMEKLLRPFDGRIVFDMDDAVHLQAPNPLPRLFRFLEDGGQIRSILKRSKSAIVSNEELAGDIRSFHPSVHVVPTPVDTDYFFPVQRKDTSDMALRLLWMGNRSGNPYVNQLAPVLHALVARGVHAQLAVVSDSPDLLRFSDFPRETIRYVPWSLESEKAQLQWAHVGVMPLSDSRWNRAKSGFKAMIYMAAGLPSVCSPVGSIDQVIEHGHNGFFAKSEMQWIETLLTLARDANLRNEIGRRATETITEKYSLKALYPRFKEALGVAA